jgi:hypothetical protein
MNASRRVSSTPALFAVPVVLLLCWAIPRAVVRTLGVDGHWAPFFYQYLLGGLVFLIGLWVIRASGACDFRRTGDKLWFWVLIYGYFSYAAMHGIVTWLAVAVPFKGN